MELALPKPNPASGFRPAISNLQHSLTTGPSTSQRNEPQAIKDRKEI